MKLRYTNDGWNKPTDFDNNCLIKVTTKSCAFLPVQLLFLYSIHKSHDFGWKVFLQVNLPSIIEKEVLFTVLSMFIKIT